MAIIRQRGLQVTVNTIAERNTIVKRPEHLVVHVKDAIADVDAGVGPAVYRWTLADGGKWMLISAGAEKTISFETKEMLIQEGVVYAPNIPMNNNIWDITVLDGNIAIAFPRIEDLSVVAGEIKQLDEWNGYKLRFTYAYGSLTAQIQEVLDSKSTLYELNVDPTTLTDNKVKAGDFWHDISDEGRIAIALTIGGALIWMEI